MLKGLLKREDGLQDLANFGILRLGLTITLSIDNFKMILINIAIALHCSPINCFRLSEYQSFLLLSTYSKQNALNKIAVL